MSEMVDGGFAEGEQAVEAHLVDEFVVGVVGVAPSKGLDLESAAHCDGHEGDQDDHVEGIPSGFGRFKFGAGDEGAPHQPAEQEGKADGQQCGNQQVADDRKVVPEHAGDGFGLIEIVEGELIVASLELVEELEFGQEQERDDRGGEGKDDEEDFAQRGE